MNNLFKFLVAVFISIAFAGVSEARDVIVFNNHPDTVHVREWREYGLCDTIVDGQSNKIVLRPGESTLIMNYKEGCNSIFYYVPEKSRASGVIPRKYKEYVFQDIGPDQDALVVLYPSYQNHGGMLRKVSFSMKRAVHSHPISDLDDKIKNFVKKTIRQVDRIRKKCELEIDFLADPSADKDENKKSVCWAKREIQGLECFVEEMLGQKRELEELFLREIERLERAKQDLYFKDVCQDPVQATVIRGRDDMVKSIFFEYENIVKRAFSKLHYFIAISGVLFKNHSKSTGLASQICPITRGEKGVILFNNHANLVRVRREYSGEKSQTMEIKSGQAVFIPDYNGSSICYYIPEMSGSVSGWGYLYKVYNLGEGADLGDDSLVVLYPSFAKHPTERSVRKRVVSFVKGKVVVLSELFVGKGASEVVSDLVGAAVESSDDVARISIKRGACCYSLTDIREMVSSRRRRWASEPKERLAIEKFFDIGKNIDIIRKQLFIRREEIDKSFGQVIALSDLEDNISWANKRIDTLQSIREELFLSKSTLRENFVKEVEILEKSHSVDYFGGDSKIMASERYLLSIFEGEVDSLVGDLVYLAKLSKFLQDQQNPAGEVCQFEDAVAVPVEDAQEYRPAEKAKENEQPEEEGETCL